jgi:hypothetical protein
MLFFLSCFLIVVHILVLKDCSNRIVCDSSRVLCYVALSRCCLDIGITGLRKANHYDVDTKQEASVSGRIHAHLMPSQRKSKAHYFLALIPVK